MKLLYVSSQNLHISCVGLQVHLTSELLKLPHASTLKDFNLTQQSTNGMTGSFKHTKEFHKTWNPLNCQLSRHHVITCNCYHHFNSCFMNRFSKKIVCFLLSELSVPFKSSALWLYSVFSVSLQFLSTQSIHKQFFMNIKNLFSNEIRG